MTKDIALDYSRKITQTSPTGLVVITYELISLHLADAIASTEDVISYREALKKARNLLGELSSSLDMKYEVSAELLRLYLYLNRELLLADLRKDASLLPRLKGIVDSLREAFEEVAKTDHSGPVMENTQKVYAGLTYSKGSLNEDISGDINRGFKV